MMDITYIALGVSGLALLLNLWTAVRLHRWRKNYRSTMEDGKEVTPQLIKAWEAKRRQLPEDSPKWKAYTDRLREEGAL